MSIGGGMDMMNQPMSPMDSMSNDPNMMGGDGMPPMDGEEGDENADDPKKEIQSICGKLSEKLREYNENQENPDTDLNKYVIGMILKQAAKDMTQHEKQDIINDLESGFESDDAMIGDGGNGDENSGDMPQEEPMPTESKKARIDRLVNEVFSEILSDDDDIKRKKDSNHRITRKNPFKSNRL